MSKATDHAAAEIARAVQADRRNDAAGRNHILSQLRADSDLKKRTLARMIKASGLAR